MMLVGEGRSKGSLASEPGSRSHAPDLIDDQSLDTAPPWSAMELWDHTAARALQGQARQGEAAAALHTDGRLLGGEQRGSGDC